MTAADLDLGDDDVGCGGQIPRQSKGRTDDRGSMSVRRRSPKTTSAAAAIVIWVGQKSAKNFERAPDIGVWGFAEQRPLLAGIRPGDLVVFATAFSGGNPRVQPAEWAQGSVGRLLVGRVTAGMHEDDTPIWEDEPVRNSFPYLFNFEAVGERRNVPIADLPAEIARALKPAGDATGKRVNLSRADEQTLLALVGATASAAPPPPEGKTSFGSLLGQVVRAQRQYTADSTTAPMRERKKLVEADIPAWIRPRLPPGLSTEGSGGSGDASKVPWTRVFDPAKSPAPTRGWYLVYLFAADGSSVYLSLNQGTTDPAKTDAGNPAGFRSKPPEEIADRVTRAKQLLSDLGQNADGESADIHLADPKRGRDYERGNVFAIRYRPEGFPHDIRFERDLEQMIGRLNTLYDRLPESPGPTDDPTDDSPELEAPSLEDLIEVTGWERDRLEQAIATLTSAKPQIILAGPPGTGKTWVAKALAHHLTRGVEDRAKLVQFHPTYGYEEFIEGLRPGVSATTGAIEFAVQPGTLRQFAETAVPGRRQVMILDEVNRANLPRVLGELMYALEYRDEPVNLLYTKTFRLPPALSFIGTMNTADRSIRSIDIALRRRFEIFECPPSPELLTAYYKMAGRESAVEGLADGLERLNAKLDGELDRHHTIGHSFFMAPAFTRADLERIWERQIYPLIEEYFFDQPDLAEEFHLADFWPNSPD